MPETAGEKGDLHAHALIKNLPGCSRSENPTGQRNKEGWGPLNCRTRDSFEIPLAKEKSNHTSQVYFYGFPCPSDIIRTAPS